MKKPKSNNYAITVFYLYHRCEISITKKNAPKKSEQAAMEKRLQ